MIIGKLKFFIPVLFSIFIFNFLTSCVIPNGGDNENGTDKTNIVQPPDYTPHKFEVSIRDSDRLTFRWEPVEGVSSYVFSRKPSEPSIAKTKELYDRNPKVEKLSLTEQEYIVVGSCDTHIFRDILGLHKDVSSDKIEMLKPDTAYDYMITMYDTNKTVLAKFKFTTMTGMEIPSDFMVSGKTETTITLSWSKLKAKDDYVYVLSRAQRRDVLPVDILTVDKNSLPTSQFQYSVDRTKLHFTDKDLRKGGKYYYFLRTYSGFNKSYSHRQVEVLMDLSIPDSLRANYIATIGEDGVIELTWNPIKKDGLTGYKIYMSHQPNDAYKEIDASVENKYRYIVQPADRGGRIYFKVTSVINGKESVRSASAECTLPPAPCKYLKDHNNKDMALIVLTGPKMMELRWKNPERADGVIIYRNDEEIGRFYHLYESTYTDYNLEPNKPYLYSVKSFAKAVSSDSTADITLSTPISGSDYTNPLDVRQEDVTIESSTDSVKVTLPELSPTSLQYLITYKEGTTGEYNKSPISTNNTVTVIPMLKPLTIYNLKIDVANTTPNPDKTTVNPVIREITTCPAAPIDLKDVTDDATANSVTLTWKQPVDIDKSGYNINYTIKCFDGTKDITESGIAISPIVEAPANSGKFNVTVSKLPHSNKQYTFNAYTVASKSGVSLTSTKFDSHKAYTCPKDLVEGNDLVSGDFVFVSETSKIKIICDEPVDTDTSYVIRYRKNISDSFKKLVLSPHAYKDLNGKPKVEYVHDGLLPLTINYYELSLVNSRSKLKSRKPLVSGDVFTCPAAPPTLTVLDQSIDKVTLEWPGISLSGKFKDKDSYIIKYIKDNKEHTPIEVNRTNAHFVSGKWRYIVSGLTSNSLYAFQVYSVVTNSDTNEVLPSTVPVEAFSNTCPRAPDSVIASAHGNNINLTIKGETKSYKVYLYSGTGFAKEDSMEFFATSLSSTRTYNFVYVNVSCFKNYKIKVVAMNDVSSKAKVLESSKKDGNNVTTDVSKNILNLESSFWQKSLDYGKFNYIVNLSWPALTGINRFELKRVDDNSPSSEVIVTTNVFASPYKDIVIENSSNEANVQYTYKIIVTGPDDATHDVGTVTARHPK